MSPLPTIHVDTTPCPRRADGAHVPDWASADGTTLTSYGADGADRSLVVRLMRCRACGTTLVALAAATAPDDHPGTVMQVTGTE